MAGLRGAIGFLGQLDHAGAVGWEGAARHWPQFRQIVVPAACSAAGHRSCLTTRRQEPQPRPLRVDAAQEAAGTSVGLRARNSARIGTFKAAPLQEIECVHLRGGPISVGSARTFPGRRAPMNRLRLWASAARTAGPCGESVLELTFQTLGRDVLLCLNFHRDVHPDPCSLEGDDLHVVGHVLPVRMVVALAFFKRTFARSLPMSQAHSLIVAEVDGACCVSTNTTFSGAGGQKDRQTLRFSRSI
jgi:hypothetical protein